LGDERGAGAREKRDETHLEEPRKTDRKGARQRDRDVWLDKGDRGKCDRGDKDAGARV